VNKKVILIIAVLLLFGLVGCGNAAPKVEWQLKISGAVSTPLTVTYAELAKMPQKDLTDILMQKSRGEDVTGSWSGVALEDLLAKAGAGEYVSVTAIASDGYAIEVSKDELQDAIVALKESGKWIQETDPDHGPIRLVAPTTPANRWAYQLTEIQVNAEGGGGVPANAALKITGNVESEVGWTEEKVRSMDAIQVEAANKSGEMESYTGVLLSDLLGKATPKDGATTLVFVGDDGYTAEVPLADLEGCADCIVAFREGGGFSTVFPALANNTQVKGLVEIQVK
jgi:DMSO/TMAO reductase YedYZ molybdopterin-dependent catalytic subunit